MLLESWQKLEAFLGSDYPLNKFMDRVEHIRASLEDRYININMIPREKTVAAPEPKLGATAESTDMCREIEALHKELTELRAEGTSLEERLEHPLPYCSHFRSQTHDLRDCPSKPALGLCFDYRQL